MGGMFKSASRHIYIYIYGGIQWEESPPTEDLPFCTREIAQKSRFFCRDSVGGRPKMKEFWKNFESTWSGIFFDGRSAFFKTGFWAFGGNMAKFGPKTPQNRQIWTKMDKVGQKRIFRMMQSHHVHIQPRTRSAGMCAPCQGILQWFLPFLAYL